MKIKIKHYFWPSSINGGVCYYARVISDEIPEIEIGPCTNRDDAKRLLVRTVKEYLAAQKADQVEEVEV